MNVFVTGGSGFVGSQVVDEGAPYPTRHRSLYSESKAGAEQAVLRRNREGFATISLRPRMVWGPRDTSILPAMQRMATEGNWVLLDGGRAETSTTHIDNLAHAVLCALAHPRGGEAYFISDDADMTMREFATRYMATVGVDLEGPSLPGALLRPLARGIEGLWRMVGAKRTPPLTAFAVAAMSRTVTVTIDKAKRELAYAPQVSVDEGFRRMTAGEA